MSLHWIFGCSGSGKDHYLYSTIIRRSKEEASGKYLIIVPEQFTMQTQRDMVMLSDNKGIMNIDILSFMRLAYRVLGETPEFNKPVLADEGKAMVIRRLLKEHADEWKTFGSNISKPGFVEEIKSLITEFIQYGVSVDDIDGLRENAGKKRLLSAKLEDLRLLYRYYTEYMESRYISAEEMLKLLADYAKESELLRDSVIVISGFTGFTSVQYMLLEKLFAVCRDIYIAVTIGRDTDPFMPAEKHDLFYMSTEFIRKSMNIAQKCGVYVEEPVWTGKDGGNIPWRFADNPEMCYLEKNLFRAGHKKGDVPEKTGAVNIYEAVNPYEESEYILWQINRLIRKEGLRYRDIAVVTGDITLYGRLLGAEFERAGIPYFIDYNRSILHNSFVDMVLSLLSICEKGFLYSTVIKFLRNGIVRDYMGFDAYNTDVLENYVRSMGIRGRNIWDKEWIYNGKEYYDMEAVNECRKRITELLMPFYNSMAEAETVLDYSKALYSFLVENNISEAISEIADRYGERGMRTEQKEYSQIYRIFIGLIDQMTQLMGDEILNVRGYLELLKTGISESSVGVIPMGTDAVIVGDIERTRLKDVKILFFAGVNDGIIPKAVKTGGFISDAEREYLAGLGAELAPVARDRIFNERFYLYLNATKPSDKIYISYSNKSCSGEEIKPSLFIKQVNDILCGIDIKRNFSKWGIEGKLANDKGMVWWLRGLRECVRSQKTYPLNDSYWLCLHRRYMRENSNRALFERAFFTGEDSFISKETSNLLYNHELIASISRLEQFGACAFAHFLKYGLRLKERPEYKIKIPDIGIVLHNILENFSRKLSQNNMGWKDTEDSLIDEWCDEICDAVCTQYNNGIFLESAKNEYMAERFKRISKRTIKAISYQMKQGSFEQKAFEISFERLSDLSSLNYDLGNGDVMHLTGKIDRIDACEKDDCIYIRIVDYKSRKNEFDANKVYQGLGIQLPVYLMAADELISGNVPDKKIIPAGMFYMHIDDPVLKDVEPEDIESEMCKEFIMLGLMNRDKPVPYIIDSKLGDDESGLYGGASSTVVKVRVTKDGYINRGAVPKQYFDYMHKAVADKIIDYGRRILDGDTGIEPYKIKDNTPCTYCEFNPVCGFDIKMRGNSYRKLTDISEEDIWKEWENKYGGVHKTAAESD